MYDYFYNLLMTNDIFSGALFAGGILGLLASSRGYVRSVLDFLISRNIVEFTITSSDENFIYFLLWLSKQDFSKAIKKYHITSEKNKNSYDEDYDDNDKTKFIIGPDNSRYLFNYNNKYILLSSSIEKPTQGGGSMTQIHKSVTMTYLGQNKNTLLKILEDVVKIKTSYLTDYPRVYSPNMWCDDWASRDRLKEKNMDFVFLPSSKKQKIIDHVSNFLDSKKIYQDFNIPYKTGILFYGVPGSGKTTLIRAIASKYKLNLYFLPFSEKVLESKNLMGLFDDIEPRSLVVLEDVDVLFDNKDSRKTKNTLNFSTLLNVIDGPTFSEEIILIMTTNHIKKLDAALIRSGRIDLKVCFDYANNEQKRNMFLHFNPKLNKEHAEKFVAITSDIDDLSPADIQTYLLCYKGLDGLKLENINKIKFDSIKEI